MIAELAFGSPDRLLILLVIPLLIVAYIIATHRKNRRGMRFTNTSMLDVVVPKQSQWRRHLAVALSPLSLITLTAAFAQPKTQVDAAGARDDRVVIDASLSMEATDVQPNWLSAAKQAAVAFVESLPEKYNVAVVSMSGTPTSWCRRRWPTTRSRTPSTPSRCRNPPRSARASSPRCARSSRPPRILRTPTPSRPERSSC